jgi:hypothetical protein
MNKQFSGALVFALFLLGACAQNAAVTQDSGTKSGGGQTYGASMPASPEPVALSIAMKTVADFIGKPSKLSGRVGLVCQQKGCWMMLTDGDASVRVKFGNDAFFIPKDASGAAQVFGQLEEIKMSAAHAKHMAEDAGQESSNVQASKEYRVMATSVVILP